MATRKANPGQRPRRGEPRATRQPFHLDRLPSEVHRAIEHLRDFGRKSWVEIEAQSARPYSKDWAKDDGGFVDWESLETPVLELFPDLKLTRSGLQRWFDVRIEQARAQVLKEAASAREFAQAFASATIEGGNAAVLNAMRDQVFELARSSSVGDRASFIEGLNVLTLAMSRIQRVDLATRKVSVEEKKVEQLIKDAELRRKRVEAETESMAKKSKDGNLALEDINTLRRRAFGLPPVDADGKVVAG